MMNEKICSACGEIKPLIGFQKCSGSADGHHPKCKPCVRKYVKAYRLEYLKKPGVVNRIRERNRENSRRLRELGISKRQTYSETKTAKDGWVARNREKVNAAAAVRRAIKHGILARPTSCDHCGGSDRKIDGHHPDYSKRLEVLWLCTGCHGKQHRKEAVEAEVDRFLAQRNPDPVLA